MDCLEDLSHPTFANRLTKFVALDLRARTNRLALLFCHVPYCPTLAL